MKDFLRILLLAMMVCCWGCSGGGEDVLTPTPKPENNKIEISTSAPIVEQKGGTTSVSFTTNAAWTASVGTSTTWLKVSPTSGAAGSHTLTITTEENNTYDERNATLTIKAGNASQNITVTQKQKDGLTVTSNKVEVGAEGGDFSIETKANVNVTYEIEEAAKDWISASESRGLTAKNLKFNAKANDKTERRQGNIILKGGDGLTETVTVYQAGEEVSLVLTTEKDMTIGSEGGTLKIELQSNSEIKMEELDADWLRQSSSRAMSAYTYYIEVDANETYDERNASITFVSGEKKQIVTVTQKQMDALIVNSNKVEVGADGGDFSIEAKANVNVTYEIEEAAKDWISASESRGLTAKALEFNAKANDKIERRQGNIILKGGDGLTETVTVYQAGEEVSLVLTTEKDMTIGSEGGTLKIELQSNSEIKMEELDADWLRQSSSRAMSAYTYYIEVDVNETYDERNASITFVCGDKKQIVTVTQKQMDALIVNSNKVEVGANGGDFSIEAKANVSVTFEIEESAKEWITASESRGLTAKTLNFTAKANDKTERRQGNIILKGGDGLTETVTVYQEGEKPSLVISSDDVVVKSEGETVKIELKSNVEYSMILPDVDWISKDDSRAMSAYTHYLVIAPNETYDQRSAIVYFQNETENLKDSIGITQLQKDAIIVAKNAYTVEAENNTLEFSVNTNVDFEISVSVDWIKQNVDSRGLVEKTLNFMIEKNESKDSREGEISIAFKDLKQTIKVIQKGAIDNEAVIAKEREVLIEFYKATGGENWKNNTNWCSDKPVEDWYGVAVHKNGQVKELYCSSNNLNGVIPSCLKDLTAIERLLLSSNKLLGGSIPEWIGELVNLKDLSLTHNQLTGNIPESIGNLVNLEYLLLNNNQLEGNIPESIGNLTKLTRINLGKNQLEGNIPESIGNLLSLRDYLILDSNDLSGSIPETIGNLTNLKSISLGNNKLNGNIPETIGNLTNLTYLGLAGNQLSGKIPECIGNLTKLNYLYLYNNQLSGSIPDIIGNLTDLKELWLYKNQLSGSIPENIGNLLNLETLKLVGGNNKFSGEIPENIGNLVKLKILDLNGLGLTGNIPESIGNLTNLTRLSLNDNKLSGNIPESIGNLTNLTMLDINNNQLTGGIPESITNLTKLPSLILRGNQLSGGIPKNIGNMANLTVLSLGDNLSGEIPESIGELTNLTQLSLNNNQLSGNIPESIGKLTNLKDLNFHNNRLSGSIPESIGNLTNLTYLELGNNQLNGTIPESIANLSSLSHFNLTNNLLSGKIPLSLQNSHIWKDFWSWIINENPDLDTTGIIIPAPDFNVIDIYGEKISSESEYAKNKLTILYLWASWCGFSREFNKTMDKLYEYYGDKGLEIIGESNDKAFIKTNGIQWKNFVSNYTTDDFVFKQIRTFPSVIVVDNNKQVVFNSYTQNRSGLFAFVQDYFASESSSDEELYTSTDYSSDGEIVTLQQATLGKGIDLTFLGEGFVDKDMESGGHYEQKMREAMNKLFSMEPYKSMRKRFNVYAVKVVSPNAEFTPNAQHRINENQSVCLEYAQKILPYSNNNAPMVTVVYNVDYELGRSYCTSYIEDGSFVAFIKERITDVILHETGGHGIAGLLDEYVEYGYGPKTLPGEDRISLDNIWEQYGRGANVDWRDDAAAVKWAHFLNDERYSNEGLGLYEGAYLYGHGVYRPTEESMMRYSDSPFNAPSREQIYKRIMQLSEGENWKYDYEEFVKYDEINRNNESRSAIKPLTEAERKEYIKNHRPPTFMKGTWRDAMKIGKSKVVVPLR